MGAGAAPYSAYTRPGDGPARDELWGKTEPDDWLHDKNQNHKPSHGVQRGLNVGEMTSHEWDVVPDKRSQATTAANMTVPEFGNHWGAKSGAYTTIAHHGRFGKGTTRRNASAFQTADDVCNTPWATLADAQVQLPSDELDQRRIQLGPRQTWSREPMDSALGKRQEGRKMREPTTVMPEHALRYPYGRGSHVKASSRITEPPNFGAPIGGQSVDEAVTADITGVPQWTHKPGVGPVRDHLDYSMEPHPEVLARGKQRSEVTTVDPALANTGYHLGRYHRAPAADRGQSERGIARHDLARDARVRHPLRKPTRLDCRDVRGGYYITVDYPMRFGKKVKTTSPWTVSSDDVVKKTRRYADPRGWGDWANHRDPEEIDLGFYWGLGAEGRKDHSLPLGDQYNVARPGYVYNGPRVKPSYQTATGGNTTQLLHNTAEATNIAIQMAVWEKDDAESMQAKRDLLRRGQTKMTQAQLLHGKQVT